MLDKFAVLNGKFEASQHYANLYRFGTKTMGCIGVDLQTLCDVTAKSIYVYGEPADNVCILPKDGVGTYPKKYFEECGGKNKGVGFTAKDKKGIHLVRVGKHQCVAMNLVYRHCFRTYRTRSIRRNLLFRQIQLVEI